MYSSMCLEIQVARQREGTSSGPEHPTHTSNIHMNIHETHTYTHRHVHTYLSTDTCTHTLADLHSSKAKVSCHNATCNNHVYVYHVQVDKIMCEWWQCWRMMGASTTVSVRQLSRKVHTPCSWHHTHTTNTTDTQHVRIHVR